MKHISRATFVFVIFTIATAAIHAQTDTRIANIRSEVAGINKAEPEYKKEKKDVDCISTEGAEVTIYRSGTGVKKIVAKLHGETFNAVSKFYFDGDKLIFTYDRVNRYDTQIGLKRPVKVVRVEQIRSYFDNGKMFKLIKGTKSIASTTYQFDEYERQNRETAKGILHPDPEPLVQGPYLP